MRKRFSKKGFTDHYEKLIMIYLTLKPTEVLKTAIKRDKLKKQQNDIVYQKWGMI